MSYEHTSTDDPAAPQRGTGKPTNRIKEEIVEGKTDWLLLWRQISEVHEEGHERKEINRNGGDVWAEQARKFDSQVRDKWSRPDSSRQFIISRLVENPGSTLLDIGAGTGAWACLLSPYVKQLTALDPSSAMISVMRENILGQGIDNIEILQGRWPHTRTDKHDFSLCSHAMYGEHDFRGFITGMMDVTRKTCFMLIRVPIMSSLMGELSMRIWGHPYDSVNFPIAYNALLQMEIYPNVLMEDRGLWKSWTSESLEEALAKVKGRFGIKHRHEHDDFIADMLSRHLKRENGKYIWPRGVRSALVYWDV